MQIREADHSFILLHLKELAHLHTVCFDESEVWHEHWTDYPRAGSAADSLSFLIEAAARETFWVVAIDDVGEVLDRPGRILACGILERLGEEHAAELGIELAGREGRVFYNHVYFHHLAAQRLGLAHRVIRRRIELARREGGVEIWCRTRKDHRKMHRILTEFGFRPEWEDAVSEAGERSVRLTYRKPLV